MLPSQVNVLIVDDVNSMRIQIQELLRGFGFAEIDLASCGEEALRKASTKRYQLILSDWHMQPLNGLELLRSVRTRFPYKDLAFIMITAESTRERVIEAIQSGVDDYLVKPLTPHQIQTKIFEVLFKRKVFQ